MTDRRTDGQTDGQTDGRTDGGDCNIPDAFLKKRGDKNLWLARLHVCTFAAHIRNKYQNLELAHLVFRHSSDHHIPGLKFPCHNNF